MKRVLLFCAAAWNLGATGTWVGPPSSSGTLQSLPSTELHNGGPVTYTVTCDDDGKGTVSDIQTVVNDAWRGDTLKLANSSATGNPCVWKMYSTQFIQVSARPERPGETGYFTITTTEDSKLPREGTRITPAYKPLLPTLMSDYNGPVLRLSGTLPAASHVRLRGLNITVNTAVNRDYVSVGVELGPGIGTNYWPGSTVGITWPMLKFASPSAAGTSTIQVAAVNPLVVSPPTQYVQPGMILHVGAPGTTGRYEGRWASDPTNPEGSTVVSKTDTTVTFAAPLKYAHPVTDNIEIILNDPLVGPSALPDDIVLQHCVFGQDWLHAVVRWINLNARAAFVLDNFVEGAVADNRSGQTDAQAIHILNSVGPLVIENNYLNGTGENIMPGGAAPAFDREIDSASIRFNYLPHIPERDRTGPWTWTQDESRGNWNGYGPNKGRLVFKGRTVHPSGGMSAFWRADNTGVVCTTEPLWSASPVAGVTTVDDCGVTWRYAGTSIRTIVKNNFEIKAGKNITVQYNVMDWMYDGYSYNVQQTASINVKASSQSDPYRPGAGCTAGKVWPDCYRARTTGIRVLNNLVRTAAGGIQLLGFPGYSGAAAGDYLVKDNLFIQTEGNAVYHPYHQLLLVTSDAVETTGPGSVRLDNIQILNNTYYTPFRWQTFTWGIEVGKAGFGGENRVAGNIFTTGNGGYRSSSGNNGGASIASFPGVANWGKNFIVGAPTAGYPQGSVLNNCPGQAACPENWDFLDPVYGALLRNADQGKFGISNSHSWAKRGMADGSDVGADMSQIPEIRELTTTPTDRSVLFRWMVTEPIKDIPCVVEVSDKPDLDGSYVGELSQIASWARADADDDDRNARSGYYRMAVVGFAVPLSASTTYYYRLQCGGDTRRGEFTTVEPLSGGATPTISRTLTDPAATVLQVQYGTSYSRSSDSISDAQTAQSACERQQMCSVSFPVTRGAIVYYRWSERDDTGTLLRMSPVIPLVAQ